MSTARLVLLAAAQLCCAVLASQAAAAATVSSAWSDLWRTPDQQGQALLDAGRPGRAAERFHDPRRRAYADLEAGRYQEAAQLLAPLGDPDSEYNRGNALAASGQLPAALAAYDAALKQAPGDKDIRHNRDLVERALRQQRQSSQSSSAGGRQGGRGTAASGKEPQQAAGKQQGGSGSRQQGSASRQGDARDPQSGGQMGSNGQPGGDNRPGNSPTDPNSFDSSSGGPGQARNDAAFAAAVARERQQRSARGNPAQGQGSAGNTAATPANKGAPQAHDSGSLLAGGMETPKQEPETEQQLALDQWLRRIPDSPAGLLQRKFLIEHMMKQEGDEPPPGESPQGSGP